MRQTVGTQRIKSIFIVILSSMLLILVLMEFGYLNVQAATEKVPDITYQAHVENVGWQSIMKNGQTAGTTGKNLAMEAIAISFDREATNLTGDLVYSTHVQNVGWQPDTLTGNIAGTVGKRLNVEAIKISLRGEIANKYSVYYRGHVQGIGWLPWTKDGQIAGSTGYGLRLEALEIKLLTKTDLSIAPGNGYKTTPIANYSVYSENGVWYNSKSGSIVGTTGINKGLKSFRMTLDGGVSDGSIEYSTHISKRGWINYVGNGTNSNDPTSDSKIEAIKLRLTGEVGWLNDIYYRVHTQHRGWLGWTKNDQPAGTEGYEHHVEALEIVILPKNSIRAPGLTRSFYNKKDEVIPPVIVNSKELRNGTPLENERAAFNFFVNQGYTREATAGIIGNFYAESGMDPTKKQYPSGPGRGLAQWGFNQDGGRFNELIQWARGQNRDAWNIGVQLEWTVIEMKRYGMDAKMKSIKDVSEATRYFCDTFERPNPLYAHMDVRQKFAKKVLSQN